MGTHILCRSEFETGGLKKRPLTENGGLSERPPPPLKNEGDFGTKPNILKGGSFGAAQVGKVDQTSIFLKRGVFRNDPGRKNGVFRSGPGRKREAFGRQTPVLP